MVPTVGAYRTAFAAKRWLSVMNRVVTVSNVERVGAEGHRGHRDRRAVDGWSRRDVLAAVAALGVRQPTGSLVVDHTARELAAGEVVLVRATTPEGFDATAVHATWGSRTVAFMPQDGGRSWVGLLGLDLDAPVSPMDVRVEARGPHGAPLEGRLELGLRTKSFRTRRLDVEPRYVTPPKAVQARIAREQRAIREVLANSFPTALWQGPWLRPVPGISLSSFGVRSVFNGVARAPHTGTDFRAPLGTPLRAPASGRVVLAEEHYFPGNVVVIDHGAGTFSMMAHLSRFGVAPGDRVERGAVIGATGATGRVTGPHLHWATSIAGARVDAESLLEVTAGLAAPPG